MPFSKLTLNLSAGFTQAQLVDGIVNLFTSAGFTLVFRSTAWGTFNNVPTFSLATQHDIATVYRSIESGPYGGLAIQIRAIANTSQVVVHINTGINYNGSELLRPLASLSDTVTSTTTRSPALQSGTVSGTDSNQVPWEWSLRYHNASPATYYLLSGISLTGPAPRGREFVWFWSMIPSANRQAWFSAMGGTNTMSPWYFWRNAALGLTSLDIPIGSSSTAGGSSDGMLYQIGLNRDTRSDPNAAIGIPATFNAPYTLGYAAAAQHNSFIGAQRLDGGIELRNNLLVATRASEGNGTRIGGSNWNWGQNVGRFHSDIAVGPIVGPSNTRLVVTAGSNEWECAMGRGLSNLSASDQPQNIFAGPGIYLRAV